MPLFPTPATQALQSAGNGSLSSIDAKTPALGQALAASSLPIVLTAAQLSTLTPLASVSISNLPATQAISAAALPLPSGAATSSLQSTINTTLGSPFQAGGSIGNTAFGISGTLPAFAATPTFNLGTLNGAATTALQTTGNSSLSSIDTKTPALGQALAASSVPVVLTASQLSTLTPLSSVSVSNFPASQAVTGPLTDTQLRATALPVSGTFFQATQPVSIASMPSTPVTGTFFQATQPVSGTVSANATLAAETTKVIGTVNVSAAQTIAVTNTGTFATQSTLAAETTKVIGTINLSAAQTLATVTTVGAVTAITNALPTGTNSIGTVQQAALTKGTQGATGISVQNLKDAGRNQTNYFMVTQIVSTATDALMSLTGYKGGAAVVATTTPAVVTAGKTYRINSITLTYVTIVTTPGAVRFTLRANTGGVVAIGSPAVAEWTVGEPTGIAPVAGKFNTVHLTFAEGMEFAAGTGIGISMVGLNTIGVAAVVGYGQATIQGFEY